jgi:putative transposase
MVMSKYVRNYRPGGTFFFTVVTEGRWSFLTSELARPLLRNAILEIQRRLPFTSLAMVLLPQHLHAVWILPEMESDFSVRWRRIKEEFTRAWIASDGVESGLSRSRRSQGERGIWQRRFWEHTCRNELDLKRCVDYIHWNPVKHGLVSRVIDYPYSTFHRYLALGEYPPDWGGENPCPGVELPE